MWRRVTTIGQLYYHLERGEVVAFRYTDGEGFLRQATYGPNNFEVILQPHHGAAITFSAPDITHAGLVFQELAKRGVVFWTCPGAKLALAGRPPGLLERAVTWVLRMLRRG